MTHPRECSTCARVLDYLEMQDQHIEVLIGCTSLNHDSMRGRQRELAEIKAIINGEPSPAPPWTMSARARGRIYKENADG